MGLPGHLPQDARPASDRPAGPQEVHLEREPAQLELEQPAESIYTLGLASCVHKWVQASSVDDQRIIANVPGLLPYVLDQLLGDSPGPEPKLQVFFAGVTEDDVDSPQSPGCRAIAGALGGTLRQRGGRRLDDCRRHAWSSV